MNINSNKSKGLTLIEVLVALALFAIGMLGMALFTGNAIKVASDDNVRAVALYTAANAVEQLFVAGGVSPTAFSTALDNFDTDGDADTVSTEVLGNSGRDSFTIEIIAARANNGVDVLLNNDPVTWESPINMSVEVRYNDNDDDDSNDTIVVRSSYTFVY